jgi:hypothetical protein
MGLALAEDDAGRIVSGRPIEEPTTGAALDDDGGSTEDGTAGFVPTTVCDGRVEDTILLDCPTAADEDGWAVSKSAVEATLDLTEEIGIGGCKVYKVVVDSD